MSEADLKTSRTRRRLALLLAIGWIAFVACVLIVLPACGGIALGTRPSATGFAVADKGKLHPVGEAVWLFNLHFSLLGLAIGPTLCCSALVAALISFKRWKALLVLPFIIVWLIAWDWDMIGGYVSAISDWGRLR